MDYVSISPVKMSLTLTVDHQQEERMLEEQMVTLSGASNLRREANTSSEAAVFTVTPARHGGRDRRIERVRVAHISNCLGDAINVRSE